jgi:hypothetical protein
MKKLFLVIIAAVAAFALPSCTKEDGAAPVTGDYLIMGYAGGFAGPGALSGYYLLTPSEYRKDTTVITRSVPEQNNGFDFSYKLSTAEFARVAYLRNSIPPELLQRNGADIGEDWPDAGYLEVRTTIGRLQYRWLFRADQKTSSPAIQQFVKQIMQNI